MDLVSEAFRLALESNLDALHKYIESMELRQRYDITTALTGNLRDFLEYKKSTLTARESKELGEDEKNRLCERIVETALGELPKKSRNKKSKKLKGPPRAKTDIARLLYEGEYCTRCKDCGGYKCCKYK
ncbi:uncharacterized protein [Halyomorpha halys]|uniref:uncharacterized protein n=1 Tax=Halyomorpha halys TaxID=286706 RepID=UPI0006D4F2EE|nr:uncharacterized protein LOC106689587 [Halyomorpha halys]